MQFRKRHVNAHMHSFTPRSTSKVSLHSATFVLHMCCVSTLHYYRYRHIDFVPATIRITVARCSVVCRSVDEAVVSCATEAPCASCKVRLATHTATRAGGLGGVLFFSSLRSKLQVRQFVALFALFIVILISAAPTLQNLRIGLRRRQSGKSKVPAKQRGSWPKVYLN